MDRPIEVLVVDDQPRARRSLKALLATWAQAGAVREAANGIEALQQMETACADLVVMDVMMPEMDGLTATRQIRSRWPNTHIVVLSMYAQYAEDAISAGADAFLTKGESPALLMEQLAAIAAGM
jgi:DNA-binding NarL/FixJ family response regulator